MKITQQVFIPPGQKEGKIDHVLFGRNEQGNQHFHLWVEKVLNQKMMKILNFHIFKWTLCSF
ncbi:MAG: hypothetical protein CM15mP109_15530 [Candidatus Dadabacteria bacterium]|nr:MAG: hypothetical protein CM15mP109_15530 [Candidatus Dadabacteria bacterium]